MFDFIRDIDNYEDRKIGNDEKDGLRVSTAFTSDEGYETAICDANGTHPVERYESKEAAVKGHARWLAKTAELKTITKLGWLDGLIDAKKVKLVRRG